MHPFNQKLLIFLLLVFTPAAFSQAAKVEQTFLDNAQAFFEKGEFDNAIGELDKAIQLNPRNSKAFFGRADCKLMTHDMEGALKDYTRSIELGPKEPGVEKAYNNRGIARQYVGDEIGAFSDYDRAIALNSSYAAAYNNRGVIFDKRGKPDLALKDFDRAILLDPFQSAAFTGRGNIRFRRNLVDEALADYRKSIDLDPSAAAPYIVRGALYGLKNKWEMALADLRTAIEMDSEPARIGAGILGVAFNDIDKYIAAYAKNARAFAVRGFINLLRNKVADGDRDLKKAFQLDPKLKKELQELIDSVKSRMEEDEPKK
jgi:tetratricopeptide (TPR) repeat protein